MVITEADAIAIQRAFQTGGYDSAMTELRRRFLGVTDRTASKVLYAVIQAKVSPPAPYHEERGGNRGAE